MAEAVILAGSLVVGIAIGHATRSPLVAAVVTMAVATIAAGIYEAGES